MLKEKYRAFRRNHPTFCQWVYSSLLGNIAMVTNLVVVWLFSDFLLVRYQEIPFHFLFFRYTDVKNDLGLCGFLSFLAGNIASAVVGYFVQRVFVFRSNANLGRSIAQYAFMTVAILVAGTILPAYVMPILMKLGVPRSLAPSLTNLLDSTALGILSFFVMKFVIMVKVPKKG